MNNNQRDPRWANIKLGWGLATIGTDGCTISAIGDILGVTPDVVNTKLKAVKGFSDGVNIGAGSLVVWGKIAEAFPETQVRRVWVYDNADVLSNTPNVIVEVPATPIGGNGSHWVNFIGNKQLKDPWTGTIRPTSDYPNPTGYCVIIPPSSDNLDDPTLTIKKSERDALIGRSTVAKEVAISLSIDDPDHAPIEAYSKVIAGIRGAVTACQNNLLVRDSDLAVAQKEIENRVEQVKRIQQSADESAKLAQAQIDALKKGSDAFETLEGQYQGRITALEKQVDEASKAKGKALNNLASCQASKPSISMIQKVLSYLWGLFKK
jgi:hypothetical protein